MKLLAPKYDVVFHALFKESTKDKLGKMISAILNREVKVLSIDKDRYVELEEFNDKFSIMDLRAELDNHEQCHIEIQLAFYPGIVKRLLFYWSNNFGRQLKRNMAYDDLKTTISILILGQNLEEANSLEGYEIEWDIHNRKKPEVILTDAMQLYIIEIQKIRKLFKKYPDNPLYQWIMFLDDPNSKEVSLIMRQNKDISNTRHDLERVSGDEELQELERLRIKQEHDYISLHRYEVKKFREEVRAEIRAKERARAEAKVEAKVEAKMQELVRSMLNESLSIEQISKISKLEPKEIEKLK